MGHRLLAMLMVMLIVLSGCGGGGSGGGSTPAPINSDNMTDIEIIAASADYQVGAYAELLSIFSEHGTKALFGDDTGLDLGLDSEGLSDEGYENFRKIVEISAALAEMEGEFRSAIDSVLNKSESSAGTAEPMVQLMFVDLAKKAWNFFFQGKKTNENIRKSVAATLDVSIKEKDAELSYFYSGLKNDPEFKNVNLGATPEEFLQKLTAGDLDKIAGRIHNSLLMDDPFDSPYSTVAQQLSTRPIDIVESEGLDLLEKGTDLYKSAITAGTGDFGEGVSKASDLIDKVKTYEEKGVAGLIEEEVVDRLSSRIENNLPINEKYRELVSDTGVVSDVVETWADKAKNTAKSVWRFSKNSISNLFTKDEQIDDVAAELDKTGGFGHLVVADTTESEKTIGAFLITTEQETILATGDITDGTVFSIPVSATDGEVEVTVTALAESEDAQSSTVQEIKATVEEKKRTPVVVNLDNPEAPQLDGAPLEISPKTATVNVDDFVTFTLTAPANFIPPFTYSLSDTSTGEKLDGDITTSDRVFTDEITFFLEKTYNIEYTITDKYHRTSTAQAMVTATTASQQIYYYDGETEFADGEGVFWEPKISLGFKSDGEIGGLVDGTAWAGETFYLDGLLSGTWAGETFNVSGQVTITQIIDNESVVVDTETLTFTGTITGLGTPTINISILDGGVSIHNFTLSLRVD